MSATKYRHSRLKKICHKIGSLAGSLTRLDAVRLWKSLSQTSGLILVCLTVVSCAMTPVLPPVVETAPVREIEESDVVTHALKKDDQIISVDQPWELVERAKTAPDRDAPALLVRAINTFLDYRQYADARSVMGMLMTYSLTFDERFSGQIIQARLAGVAAEHGRAIELLTTLDHNQIRDIEIKKQALNLLTHSQIASGHLPDAVATRLNIDRLVTDNEQLENQQQIVQLLQTMNALQHALLREQLFNPAVEGWLAIADILNMTDPTLIDTDLENWRRTYPNHPAQIRLIERYAALSALDEYQQIALLLPLTSNYGTVARAFYDGFMRAHNNDVSLKSPRVILYDVGEEPYLSSFYYQTAINNGADFVVGPLGRAAADALLSAQQQTAITTLLIAEVPAPHIANNLFGISLSAEKEARQTADKAFADGHRQATVLRNHSKWGERVADAFADQWQSLGGIIVKNKSFPKHISDYTRVIQKLLGLDKSTARKRLLEVRIDARLKFTARRNDDIDLLFLAANADQARLIVPQLRFFQAHDLPIYATSYVYSGNPNPVVDADLDGLIFGDMRWIFEDVSRYKSKIAAEQARKSALQAESTHETTSGALTGEDGDSDIIGIPSANVALANVTSEPKQMDEVSDIKTGIKVESDPQEPLNTNPYKNSTLNRLYALGIQSYQLIPRLNLLRNKTMTQFFGKAMTVSVDQDGGVVRLQVWAKFISGLAEPIDLQIDLN